MSISITLRSLLHIIFHQIYSLRQLLPISLRRREFIAADYTSEFQIHALFLEFMLSDSLIEGSILFLRVINFGFY
ncbi:hypothetical protein L1887_23569 [Cichorium endivia]|nr:hypothetical protein L1887_23569 [Cichorium endivia]